MKKIYSLAMCFLLAGCTHQRDSFSDNPYFEKGKISCNGYNAEFKNIPNAFDNNPETYAELTLNKGKTSFIHIVVDITKNENLNTISKMYIKAADETGGKTVIFTTIPEWRPNSEWQDILFRKLYERDTFHFYNGTYQNINLLYKKTHFYFSADTSDRLIKIYSISFYDKENNLLTF